MARSLAKVLLIVKNCDVELARRIAKTIRCYNEGKKHV